MLADLKNTVKQTSIYSVGNLSSKLIGFILLPLYTSYLTTAEYGILAIIEASGQILIGIFAFSLPTAMLRWCATEKEEQQQKSIVFTTLISTLLIAVSLSIVLIPFSSKFSILFFNHTRFTNYFIILFLSVSFGILNNVPLNLIRLKEKSFFYIIITSLKFATILLLNIYFVVYKKTGVEGIILSQLIGNILLLLLTTPFLLKNVILRFKFKVLKEMFSYGFPLIFTAISALALSSADKYIIKFFIGDAGVGIFSLGHKFGSIINVFLLQSFQLGFLPIAYKMYNKPNAKRYFSKVLTYYAFILVFAVLALSLFSMEIIKFLSHKKSFWPAYSLVPLISFAFIFKGMQYVISLGFHYVKRTSFTAYIVLGTAIFNIILNILLVPQYGYSVSAYIMVISFFIMSVLTYYFSQRLFHIPYEIKKITTLILVGSVLFGLSTLTNDSDLSIRLLVKSMLLISFPAILYFLKFYEKIELLKIKEIFSSIKR